MFESMLKKRKAGPKETRNFVPQFIAATLIGDNCEKYGFKDIKYYKPSEYDELIINKVIDLKIKSLLKSAII